MTSGTITRLEGQTRRPDRFNVYLDGQFALALSARVIAEAGLTVGQVLGEQEVGALLEHEAFEQAYVRAIRLLSYRSRSELEVRQRLARAGLSEALVERVIARLRCAGLLDDATFAESWVEQRTLHRPRGAQAVRAELLAKGIDPELAGQLAETVDEAAGAEAVARRRATHLRGLDYPTFRQRLGSLLARRGFSYDIAEPIIGRLWRELASDAEASTDHLRS